MIAKLRDPVSGLMHFFSALAALLGLIILLLLGSSDVGKEISLVIYGISLILMFAASSIYHLVKILPEKLLWLRKLDHSAIYFLIAGTYTPICLHFFTGFWQWGLLAIIWGIALVGISINLFVINAPRWVTAGIYLLMGWLSIMGVREMLATMPIAAIVWLALGGLFFTVGAFVYILKKPDFYPGLFGFHEVWHIFVILGCACHFILIAVFVAL